MMHLLLLLGPNLGRLQAQNEPEVHRYLQTHEVFFFTQYIYIIYIYILLVAYTLRKVLHCLMEVRDKQILKNGEMSRIISIYGF